MGLQDKKSTIQDVLDRLSGDLYLATDKKYVYLMERCHAESSANDLVFCLSNAKVHSHCRVGETVTLNIPDYILDSDFNALKNEDMGYSYGISEKDIEIITYEPWCDWSDKAMELGYGEFAERIKPICDYCKENGSLREISDTELEEIIEGMDGEDADSIVRYKLEMAEQGRMEPDLVVKSYYSLSNGILPLSLEQQALLLAHTIRNFEAECVEDRDMEIYRDAVYENWDSDHQNLLERDGEER